MKIYLVTVRIFNGETWINSAYEDENEAKQKCNNLKSQQYHTFYIEEIEVNLKATNG